MQIWIVKEEVGIKHKIGQAASKEKKSRIVEAPLAALSQTGSPASQPISREYLSFPVH